MLHPWSLAVRVCALPLDEPSSRVFHDSCIPCGEMNSGISEVGDVGIQTELDSAASARSRGSGDLLSLRSGATGEPAFFTGEAKVGGRDPLGGDVVVAIFELGRNRYAICCAEPDRAGDRTWADPIVLGTKQVYSATEFAG
jgi:hypothetical protein